MSAKIQRLCRRAEFRLRLARGARLGLWISAGAALTAALTLATARALGIEFSDTFFLAAPGAVGLLAFCGAMAFARRPLGEVALLLEERHGLKNRLSVALALTGAGWAGPDIAGAVIEDAEARLDGVNPASVTEWRLRPPLFMNAGAMTALALTVMFFPQLDLLKKRAERKREEAEVAARVEQAKTLQKLAEELKQPPPMAMGREPFNLDDELRKLVDDLKNPKLSQTQAMLQVSDLRQKLQRKREEMKKLEPKVSASKAMEMESEAAAKLARELAAGKYAEAAKTAQEIAEMMQSKEGDPAQKQAELEKLQRDFGKLAEAMKNRPDLAQRFQAAAENLEKQMSEEAAREMRELARDLNDMEAMKQAEKEMKKADQALKEAQKRLGEAGQEQSQASDGAKGEQSDSEQNQRDGQEGQEGQEGQQGEQQSGENGEKGQKSSESLEKSSAKTSGMGKQKSSDSQQQENSGEPSDQESGELSDQDFSAAEASEQEQWDGQQQSNSQQARKAARAARQARQSKSGSCPHGKKDGECSSCKNGGVHGNQTVLPGGKAKSGWGSSSGNYDTQAAVLGQGKQENRFGDEQRRADEREFMNRMRQSQMNPNTADTRVKGERGDGPIVGERSIPIPAGHETPTVGVGAPADPVAIEKRSLDQQDIPLDYRPSVRRYFDSIEVPKN